MVIQAFKGRLNQERAIRGQVAVDGQFLACVEHSSMINRSDRRPTSSVLHDRGTKRRQDTMLESLSIVSREPEMSVVVALRHTNCQRVQKRVVACPLHSVR